MKKIISLVALVIMVAACKKDSVPAPITDNKYDSTDIKYDSIKIGTQNWMTKNLDVTHYRNGDSIPQVKDADTWASLTTGAWCWYNNDSATYAVYGKLYNWYAVNDPRGLAPTGWHVPSDSEWDILSTHLGNNAGDELKDTGTIEAGTGLWYAPNTGATNKTGFTGLPGGMRIPEEEEADTSEFSNIGYSGLWWSSTQTGTRDSITSVAADRDLIDNFSLVYRFEDREQYGFSVRCIGDLNNK